MRRAGLVLAAGLGGCAATVVDRTPPTPGPADLVVTNARVVTLDDIRPEAEAFAVTAGRFRVVGTADQMRPYLGLATKVIDAKGAAVFPGLVDAHLHLLGEGFRLMRLDLTGTARKEDVLVLVKREAEQHPERVWLRGRGWDQNDWAEKVYPSASDLDAVVPDRPVALTRIDGHALWVNSKALEAAGIAGDTPDPSGGKILRDASGKATGILIDNAADLVQDRIPRPTRAEQREAALKAMRECAESGLTGVHEPGLDGDAIDVLKELGREGKLGLRVYVMLTPGPTLERYLEAGPEVGLFGQRLTVRAVKFYADGALGSRGAALLKDYSDDPGNKGLMVTEPAELEKQVRRVVMAGLQPCIHAIGDRANRDVLDLYQRVLQSAPGNGAVRPRIEHAQILAPADIPRFASLGVIASMQPTHATSDMPWAMARLGPERLQGAYAWRSLTRAGARLAFGSDAPVESVRPLLGLFAATTRTDAEGKPPGGWLPQERLGIEEALRAYTVGPAYAAFEEEVKGTIAPGRLADFVMLSEDPRRGLPDRMLQMKVLATYVGGEATFDAERAEAAGR